PSASPGPSRRLPAPSEPARSRPGPHPPGRSNSRGVPPPHSANRRRTLGDVGERDVVRLREQISNLHSLFVLSMMMTESRDEDEILSLAVTSVASLGPCRVDGAYRPAAEPGGGGPPERFREPAGRLRKALGPALLALG